MAEWLTSDISKYQLQHRLAIRGETWEFWQGVREIAMLRYRTGSGLFDFHGEMLGWDHVLQLYFEVEIPAEVNIGGHMLDASEIGDLAARMHLALCLMKKRNVVVRKIPWPSLPKRLLANSALNADSLCDHAMSFQSHSTTRRAFSKRVLCIPANDQADEVTAAMLAQMLEQAGHSALSIAAHTSPADVLALIERRQDDVVCISALPPYTFPAARAMCKLIRERFPKLRVVIGVWGFSGDTEKAKARFERTQPEELFTSLTQAIEQIQQQDVV